MLYIHLDTITAEDLASEVTKFCGSSDTSIPAAKRRAHTLENYSSSSDSSSSGKRPKRSHRHQSEPAIAAPREEPFAAGSDGTSYSQSIVPPQELERTTADFTTTANKHAMEQAEELEGHTNEDVTEVGSSVVFTTPSVESTHEQMEEPEASSTVAVPEQASPMEHVEEDDLSLVPPTRSSSAPPPECFRHKGKGSSLDLCPASHLELSASTNETSLLSPELPSSPLNNSVFSIFSAPIRYFAALMGSIPLPRTNSMEPAGLEGDGYGDLELGLDLEESGNDGVEENEHGGQMDVIQEQTQAPTETQRETRRIDHRDGPFGQLHDASECPHPERCAKRQYIPDLSYEGKKAWLERQAGRTMSDVEALGWIARDRNGYTQDY